MGMIQEKNNMQQENQKIDAMFTTERVGVISAQVRQRHLYDTLPDDYRLFLYENEPIQEYLSHLEQLEGKIVATSELLPDFEEGPEKNYFIIDKQYKNFDEPIFLAQPHFTNIFNYGTGYFGLHLAKQEGKRKITQPKTYPSNPRWSDTFDGCNGSLMAQLHLVAMPPEYLTEQWRKFTEEKILPLSTTFRTGDSGPKGIRN